MGPTLQAGHHVYLRAVPVCLQLAHIDHLEVSGLAELHGYLRAVELQEALPETECQSSFVLGMTGGPEVL